MTVPASDPQPGPDRAGPEGYLAVLVPADDTRPCTRITLPRLSTGAYRAELGRYVGGTAQSGQYDRDAIVYVESNSAEHMAPNRRLTRYIWGHSEAAARNQTDPDHPAYWLHGDAVITGAGTDQDPLDVPRRILTHFQVEDT